MKSYASSKIFNRLFIFVLIFNFHYIQLNVKLHPKSPKSFMSSLCGK